ncbi:acyl-CoA thioesterase [Sphingomonas carotinifaciens]|jgi:acyl-CoA thioesterase YciA|uniref:Acyl-CoA thioesterase n=1 Tax=Sphingomonas carotinifaciens TaxID=1166323 RepID=A0A1G7JDF7_9SPHN|nr:MULTISPECIES: acyl-CoA thioesterase [Sphingomonas]MBB4084545.1 acyl-CoA thioesterase YciA [Sphingomonas carotinifaciens]MWC43937.1 acyl-CoA thioesterase [Sphingomonas carotinifaciens]SDF22519.1 acyl-CoA thioesterase YciA [Sphingomonas carotinifaciens]
MSSLPGVLPDGAPTIRVTAMPADANPYGDIFGGWLMGQMDLAAGSVASRHSGGRAVTVAAEGMKFHRPVIVGDEVSVYATLVATGSTSMTIDVEAWRRSRHKEEAFMVTQARFVFVAMGEDRQPRRVPPMAA